MNICDNQQPAPTGQISTLLTHRLQVRLIRELIRSTSETPILQRNIIDLQHNGNVILLNAETNEANTDSQIPKELRFFQQLLEAGYGTICI